MALPGGCISKVQQALHVALGHRRQSFFIYSLNTCIMKKVKALKKQIKSLKAENNELRRYSTELLQQIAKNESDKRYWMEQSRYWMRNSEKYRIKLSNLHEQLSF